MYGQNVHGMPSGGIEVDDSRNEGRAPREDDDEAIGITMGEMQWRRAGDRRNAHNQHRISYQHQGQRHQRQPRDSSKLLQQKLQQIASEEESISSPSSSSSSPSRAVDPPSSDPATGESPPGRSTVDKLARKLSKQNLQHSSRFHGQSLPPITPDLVTDDPKPAEPVSAGPSSGYTPHWVPLPSLDMGCAIEVDEEEVTLPKPEDKRLEFRKLRRQASAPLRSATPGGLRTIDARLQAMIANESQCNVRSEPVSTPSASALSTIVSSEAQPAFIEPDPDCSMSNWDPLEADDDTSEGCEVIPTDSSGSHRHQYLPGGIRKFSVGGISLRYRLSVDAALRCQNVVKNRPRMRRRDKTSRHGSAMSSAMTSAVTSAVNSPVIPPATLSSTPFPPPPPPPPPPRYE